MNVGASKPSDYGRYFQWGDTQGWATEQVGKDKQFTWDDYKWSVNGSSTNFRKYKTEGDVLELEDDAAHVIMGGDWHMPTPEQIQELINETDNTWTTQDGVNGRLFTSKTVPSKSIFFPAAGNAWDGSLDNSGGSGNVWSSMLSSNNVNNGQNLSFNSGNVLLYSSSRYYGRSVRGVLG